MMASTWEDVAPRRPRLSEVNANLTCMLCRGYLVDATTIVECLHSFCRSCIIQHLHVKCYCPICEMMINIAKPNIKPDKALQDIVYKMVPGLFEQEMERRRVFYESHPEAAALASPEQRGEDMERLIFSPDDKISLSLELVMGTEFETLSSCSSDSGTDSLTSAPTNCGKRYLECPAKVKISHLKKFLTHKYDIDPNRHSVNVLYKRVPLPDFYTLMDIAYIYTWKRNEPMRFFYSFVETISSVDDFVIFKSTNVIQSEADTESEEKPNIKDEDVDINNCETGPVERITEHFVDDVKLLKIGYNSFEKCLQNNEDSVLNNDMDINNSPNGISKEDLSESAKLITPSNQNDDEESDLEKSQFLESIQLTARKSCSPQKNDEISVDTKLNNSPHKLDKITMDIQDILNHPPRPLCIDIMEKKLKSNSPKKLEVVISTNVKSPGCSPQKSDHIVKGDVKHKSPQKPNQIVSENQNESSVATSPSKKIEINKSKTNVLSPHLKPEQVIGNSKVVFKSSNILQDLSPQMGEKSELPTLHLMKNCGDPPVCSRPVPVQKTFLNSKSTKLSPTKSNLQTASHIKSHIELGSKNSSKTNKSPTAISDMRAKLCKLLPQKSGKTKNLPVETKEIASNISVDLPKDDSNKITTESDQNKILTDQNKQTIKSELIGKDIKHLDKPTEDSKQDVKSVTVNPLDILSTISKQSLNKVPDDRVVSHILQACLATPKGLPSRLSPGLGLYDESVMMKNGKRKTYAAKVNPKKRKLNNIQGTEESKNNFFKTMGTNAKNVKNLRHIAPKGVTQSNINSKSPNKVENSLLKKTIPDVIKNTSENNLGNENPNRRLDKVTENLKQSLISATQKAIILKDENKGTNVEFGTNTLKSLIDSGCFNLPSSLTISLTESKDPVSILNRNMGLKEMTLMEIKTEQNSQHLDIKKRSSPVNNFIEILKLPDACSANTECDSSIDKSESETKGPGPVPKLKPIDAKVAKTSTNPPQTFQQTFLQSLQQIDPARFLTRSTSKTEESQNSPKAFQSSPKTQNRSKRSKNDTALDLSNGQSKEKIQSHNMALQIPSLFNRPRPSSLSSSSPSPSPPCEYSQPYKHSSLAMSLTPPHMSALAQQALLYQQLKINQLEIMASQSTFSTAAMVHFVKSLQAQNNKSNQSTNKTAQQQLGNAYPPKTKQ